MNPWSDTAWYFLRADDSGPVRIETDPGLGGDVDTVLTVTDFHQFHELEQETIIRSAGISSGRSSTRTRPTPFPSKCPTSCPEPARLEVRLMGRSVGAASPYAVTLGDSVDHPAARYGLPDLRSCVRIGTGDWTWTLSSELIQVGLTLDAQVTDAKGWLDYVRITGTRSADMSGGSQQEFVRASEGPRPSSNGPYPGRSPSSGSGT